MNTIGSYEAKTKLSELIERAAEGETFIITKHGRPVAKLASLSSFGQEDILEAIASLADIRSHSTLGVSLSDARGAGRM